MPVDRLLKAYRTSNKGLTMTVGMNSEFDVNQTMQSVDGNASAMEPQRG